jgi:hypothetical protein
MAEILDQIEGPGRERKEQQTVEARVEPVRIESFRERRGEQRAVQKRVREVEPGLSFLKTASAVDSGCQSLVAMV